MTDAHRALAAGTEPRELRPWLMGVGHHAALGVLRRMPPAWQELGEDVDGVPQPAAIVAQREELRAMMKALNALPERQRRAIVLRECEGRSWQEVAHALGTGEGAVRQLLHRAREQLRAGVAVVSAPVWLWRADRARAALAALGGGKGLAGTGAIVVALGGGAVVVSHHGAAAPAVARASAPAAGSVGAGAPVAAGDDVVVTDGSGSPGGGAARRHGSGHAHDTVERHSRARRTAGAHAGVPHAGRSPVSRDGGSGGHGTSTATGPSGSGAGGSAGSGSGSSGRGASGSGSSGSGSSGGSGSSTPTTSTSTSSSDSAITAGDPSPTTDSATSDNAPAGDTTTTSDDGTTTDSMPTGPAPPPAIGSVSRYEQSAGFGGPLDVTLSGSTVSAYFGELTTLRCHMVQDGVEVAVETCDKSHLVAGVQVSRAEHAINATGHDVWTTVELLIDA